VRLGVVDVGSNTVHLSIIEAERGTPPLPNYSTKTRLHLAESVDENGALPADAIDRLVDSLRAATDTCERRDVDELRVFATAVIRDAANCDEVVKRIGKEADVELQLLSGEEEARLMYSAARRWFGWSSGPMVVLDIGGGSLEIASGRNELPSFAISYPLGAGRLTREWLPDARPSGRQIRELRDYVREEIRDAVARSRWEGTPPFAVGTSKTFRQLARLAGAAPGRAGPFVPRSLDTGDVKHWEKALAGMRPRERARQRGVSKRRARQIVAGAVVARTVMRALNIEGVAICPWAVREGVILSRLDAGEAAVATKEQTRLVVAAAQ